VKSANSELTDILLLLNANLVRLDRQILILQQEQSQRVDFFKEIGKIGQENEISSDFKPILENLSKEQAQQIRKLPSQIKTELENEVVEKWTNHIRSEQSERKSEIGNQEIEIRNKYEESKTEMFDEISQSFDPILLLASENTKMTKLYISNETEMAQEELNVLQAKFLARTQSDKEKLQKIKKLQKLLTQVLDKILALDTNDRNIITIDSQSLLDLAEGEIYEVISATQLSEKGVLSSKVLTSACPRLIAHASKMQYINAENYGLLATIKAYFWSKFSSKSTTLSNFEPGNISNASILATFEDFIAKKDLDGAARIINQSDGEVRRIFSDWLEEARRHLEMRLFFETLKQLIEVQLLNNL